MNDAGGLLLIGLIFLVVVFLILREFWCWYWKINLRVSLFTKQNKLLGEIALALNGGKARQGDEINKQIHGTLSEENSETQKNGFVSLAGEDGEAFCLGCRQLAPKTNLFYNKSTNSYYHEKCLPNAEELLTDK